MTIAESICIIALCLKKQTCNYFINILIIIIYNFDYFIFLLYIITIIDYYYYV